MTLSMLAFALHLIALAVMPFVMTGAINRTKSWWAGRRGPGMLQSAWDLARLLHKQRVVSHTASPLFLWGPHVVLVCTLLAGLMMPLTGRYAPLQFSYDFVAIAYALGLGRIVLMICAMEVGSAFEGMGAAREASFSSFAEPGLFLLLGSMAAAVGPGSLASLVGALHDAPLFTMLAGPLVAGLLILLQTESSRQPVDDPQTHLELTMVHEVMVLDHSGPELAAMQYAAMLKMTLYAGLIAALLNPLDPILTPLPAALLNTAIMLVVAVVVGCTESLFARLPLRWVPGFVLLAGVMGLACMIAVGLGGHGA